MIPAWYTPPSLTRYTGRDIIARVAKLHDVDPEEITGPSRMRHLCDARREVIAALFEGMDLGSAERIVRRASMACAPPAVIRRVTSGFTGSDMRASIRFASATSATLIFTTKTSCPARHANRLFKPPLA